MALHLTRIEELALVTLDLPELRPRTPVLVDAGRVGQYH
jgi:hypothetical protein